MFAVTFAVPQESRAFRAELQHAGRSDLVAGKCVVGNLGTEEVIVLHTGVGDAAATRTTEALLAAVRPRCLVAAGFAGALDPQLRVGDLVIATNVSRPELRERAAALLAGVPRVFFGPIVGTPFPIESVAAKAEYRRASSGLAVDMETAAVFGAAMRARVPFLAARAISDTADQPLPVPFAEWFDLAHQRPRPLALASYLRRHPASSLGFLSFVAGLRPASARLRDFLVRFIAA